MTAFRLAQCVYLMPRLKRKEPAHEEYMKNILQGFAQVKIYRHFCQLPEMRYIGMLNNAQQHQMANKKEDKWYEKV